MPHTPRESDRVVEELRICRLELAQVRAAQEQSAETSATDNRRLKRVTAQLKHLAEAVDAHLEQHEREGKPARVIRVGARLVGRRSTEEEDAALLLASDHFAGPWYLIQHPEVVASGQSSVLHYLRHGADAGFDPSPDFSTRGYLRDHPDVAEAGLNPLVHFLTDERPNAEPKQ